MTSNDWKEIFAFYVAWIGGSVASEIYANTIGSLVCVAVIALGCGLVSTLLIASSKAQPSPNKEGE